MSLFAVAPMIPSAFSEMVSHETGLENLLELYQPSDIIKDPSLLLSFRRFFQRGTRVECCELLPEGFEPSSGFACARDPLAPRQASIRGATPQSHSPPHACLSQEITEPSSVADTHSTNISKVQRFPDSLKRYFETLHIPAKRRNRLYRVAQRIAKSETCGEYHEIEPIEPSVQRDPFATAKEMYQVLVGSSKTAVTLWNRVYYVYFADAVDRYGMSLSNSSVGRGMKSLALDKLAKDLKVTRPNVVGMYTVGCKYLTCMEAGGPGSLLSIDGAKSDIEKCNDEDFEILFNYRKNVHPDLEERSRCLDFEIVQKLVCGLRTQGVDNADIATGSTRLIRMICKYVDAGEILSHGKIVSIKRRGERECHDTSHISSGRSSPSQSPQVEEHTSSNGEKDVSSSPGSGEQRIDLCQLPLPTKDSMSVDQTYGNSSVITNGVNVGEQQLSLPQLLSTAGKSNLDPRGIGLPLLRNSAEAERYDAMADYSSKRRRLDGDRSDRDVDRGDITPDVVSLQQDPQERSTQLDAQDFSTDIDEWLQEFGNIDSSNGMDFVVELLQTW